MTAYSDDELKNNDAAKPNAYPVDDDNLKEESLKKTFLGGEVKNADAPGMESHGAGGHNFGEENQTPSGDAPNNPSQNAGYTNAYLARTEPSDEKTDKVNFKSDDQDGEHDYESSRSARDVSPDEDAD
ncbi:hypothetical protein LJ707_09960 [Mucilaginibacter sp. UR6-1]|uniref:hypothetical protein n=1 Tax=Mucilaginibacter sp. UR6-1 TaxID=1435643 RepID=UPI001E57E85C|nr:hypothetical protein [Mucilaginibacter sp. UR6-1]MCC8409258.1 hypothetical protein [Mucilaginibacter sp. UR6-1]